MLLRKKILTISYGPSSIALGRFVSALQAEIVAILSWGSKCFPGYSMIDTLIICTDSQRSLKCALTLGLNTEIHLKPYRQFCNPAMGTWTVDTWVSLETTMLMQTEPSICVSIYSLIGHISSWRSKTFNIYWSSLVYAWLVKHRITLNAKNARSILSLSRRNMRRRSGVLTGNCYHNPQDILCTNRCYNNTDRPPNFSILFLMVLHGGIKIFL